MISYLHGTLGKKVWLYKWNVTVLSLYLPVPAPHLPPLTLLSELEQCLSLYHLHSYAGMQEHVKISPAKGKSSSVWYTTSPAILIRAIWPCGPSYQNVTANNNHAIGDATEKRPLLRWDELLATILHIYPSKSTVIVEKDVVHHALSLPLQENGLLDLLSILSHRCLARTWKDMTSRLQRFWYQAIEPMSCQGAYRWGLSRPKNHGGMWQGLAHWKKVALLSGVGDAEEKETITKCRGLVRMGLRKNDGWMPPLENRGY